MKPLNLFAHSGVGSGESVNADDLFSDAFGGQKLVKKGDLLSSDMDGTMFHEDLGILIFLQTLKNSKFWTFPPDRFEKILLPKGYRQILSANDSGVPEDECTKILNLADDLGKVYRAKKKMMDNGEDLSTDSEIVTEFAARMIELDNLLLKHDWRFMKQLDGKILSRTRFLAGKNLGRLKDITSEIVRATSDASFEIVSRSELVTDLGLKVDSAEIQEKSFQLRININQTIKRLLQRATGEQHFSQRCIATTNLQAIGHEVIKSSSYGEVFTPKEVIGSIIKTGEDQTEIWTKMAKKPVFGIEKMSAIRAHYPGSQLRMALGDSLKNDFPMGIEALKNKGVFVYTIKAGSDLEEAKQRIESEMKELEVDKSELGQNWKDRVWYSDSAMSWYKDIAA